MKKTLIALLLLTHGLFAEEVKNSIEVPILTPGLKNRQTLKLRLGNGLEAYLISDPTLDKSGAALSVKVGSFDDPADHPGLAHFTEHMLFMGTKKYPKEAEYQSFISTHGGQTNAFTTNDSTNYMFSVDNRYYDEALDRFSDFFKEPLFNPSGVSRELQAVDQEYAKNLQSDFIKQYHVQKVLANPEHPFSRFSMGNSATLAGVTQEALQKFYQEHYSANLMRLIVISPLPLDQLKTMVEKDFSGIENKNKQSSSFPQRATSPKIDQNIVYIEPLRELRTLDIIWEIPQSFVAMKASKPDRLICYVMGHEGEKSLLAELKKEDLAETLACGELPLSNAQALFYLDIGLTEKGLKQRDTVVERVFQAIANLKTKALPPYLFQNMQDVERLRYQYQPSEDVFTYLMKQIYTIQDEELESYPIKTAITQKFDPEAVKALLNFLTPQNAHIELVTQGKNLPISFDQTEKWTDTKYAVQPLPKEKLEAWGKAVPHFQIDLPEQNPYIPQSLALLTTPKDQTDALTPHPAKLISSEKATVYFAQDQKFHVPQVYWYFEIKTPKITMGDAASLVLGDLYIKMITETLNHVSYQAQLADLSFSLQRTNNGVSVTITGYSDKAETLFDEILKHLKTKTIPEEKFKIYKDSLCKQYQNFSKESSLSQGLEIFRDALYKKFTTEKDKANAIKKINLPKFQTFLNSLFDETFVEGMLYGNMKEGGAHDLSNKLLTSLNSAPFPPSLQFKPEALKMNQEKGPFIIEKETKSGGNALVLTIEGNPFTFKERASQQISMKTLSQPFFSNLRTKQQTGYIVQSLDKEVEKQLFNIFLIQSSTHDSHDLLARTEQFIEHLLQEMEHECDKEHFETIKGATLFELKQPPKSLKEMGELLATLAFKFEGDFDWLNKRIQGMEGLTYAEFLKFNKQFLGRQNKKRLAILVNGAIPLEKRFKFNRLRSITELKQISEYQPFSPES